MKYFSQRRFRSMNQSHFEQLKSKIRGPVYPIPPAFNEDYSVNYKGVAEYVKFLNSYNVRTIMVTAGTSRFNLLSNEEIKKLNETVVESNNGKAITIVANPMIGSTANAIEFAQHAQHIGADAILLYHPERYYNDDRVYAYVETVASHTDAGVLIHGIPMRSAYAGITPTTQYSTSLCQQLSSINNVIGMKEEGGNDTHRYKLATRLHNKMTLIVSGASMRMFLGCVLFGIDAYLVGVGSFAPEVEESFYRAVQEGDYKKSLEFVLQYEDPFFEVAFPMGWHIAMKGAMQLLGIMPAIERPPLQPTNEEEYERLRKVLIQIGLLNIETAKI